MEPISARHTAALCSMAILAGYAVTPRQQSVYYDVASKDEKNRIDAEETKRRNARKNARASRKRNRK